MNKEYLKFVGEGTVVGGLIGFGLSFTVLSPLIVGGIIGFSPITALYIRRLLCNEAPKDKKYLVIAGTSLTIAAAVGVALGAATSSLFPDIMLNTWSAVLASAAVGAVIGAVGVMSSIFASEYIIEPVVEKMVKCFSKEAPAIQ